MSSPQNTTVRCPNCGNPVQANIHTLVDVGKQPALKNALLRGQINAVACPTCGYRGVLANPFIYHDPAKQLALILMPMELGLKRDDEERQIGRLSNLLMESYPPEQRKMYMLQPKRMLTVQSLLDEILQADGITREMLDKQAAQVRLLETLLQGATSEESFKQLVQQHKVEINQDFVNMVAAVAQSTAAQGDQQSGAQLLQVAEMLARETGLKAPTGEISADELIEELQQVQDDEELRDLVAAARPALDYKFYQSLTSRIESSQGDEAKRLKQLRDKLLDITQQQDRETEAALRGASGLLQKILQSSDPKKAVAANLDKIDDAFMMVLQANIQQAEQQQQENVTNVLRDVYQEVLAQLEARMPPEMKLINQVLRMQPGERAAYLREHASEFTPQVMQALSGLVAELTQAGRSEVAQEVRGLMSQIAAWQKPVPASISVP